MNLHHFLYREAVAAGPQSGPRPQTVNSADLDELKALSPEDKSAWDAALAYYQKSVIRHDLLFDAEMRDLKDQLEDSEASESLPETQVGAGMKAVLLRVAPIYRKHWWSKHDAQNRKWMQELQPLVAEYGDGISTALTKIYEVPWPGNPVRVDVVAYGNWAGAYTTNGPTRPTICSTEQRIQGTAALEVLFHETSHGMMDKVTGALKAAEEAVNARRSRPVNFRSDLWHEVLFYTSGEVVAERFPGYVPYAEKNGLWAHVWLASDHALIEQDWKPHMNGNAGLEQSLKKLVEDLAAKTPSE
jgi:hypothetical protein